MLPVLEPGGQLSFLVLLCDSLGLYSFFGEDSLKYRPEETLCTALLFRHRYGRWNESHPEEGVDLDEHVQSESHTTNNPSSFPSPWCP